MTQSSAHYFDKYETIRFRREDGILEMAIHSNGDSLRWSLGAREDLRLAFCDIAADRDNRIVIFTGTGAEFSGTLPAEMASASFDFLKTPMDLEPAMWGGKHFHLNMLNIEVPMIAAVNGPAHSHMELPLLCDIVLASETAVFTDALHVDGNLPPGDGINIAMLALLGPNRSRYFHLMGQQFSARQAEAYGLVNEVLPKDKVLDRAWEIARGLARKPLLYLRYSRAILVQPLKKMFQDNIGHGLMHEGLALLNMTMK